MSQARRHQQFTVKELREGGLLCSCSTPPGARPFPFPDQGKEGYRTATIQEATIPSFFYPSPALGGGGAHIFIDESKAVEDTPEHQRPPPEIGIFTPIVS